MAKSPLPKKKAADTSPKVFQREKISYDLHIRERSDLTEKQIAILKAALDKDTRAIAVDGLFGSGKAQPLDSLIVTPFGYQTMGQTKVGDAVCTPDGGTAKVLGVFPQGEKEVFKITFDDDSFTECCGNHLWLTRTNRDRNSYTRKNKVKYLKNLPGTVKTTNEIKETLLFGKSHKVLNHSIPVTKPVAFEDKKHFIHPYIMGVLIGDGCLVTSTPRITSADKEIIDRVKSLLPLDLEISQYKEIEYSICDNKANWQNPNQFTAELIRLGIHGKKSHEKSIPDEYKFTSIENRIELLRGLVDTDGYVNRGGHSVYYCTTSETLSRDVTFLVQSLGGTVTVKTKQNFYTYKEIRKQGLQSYNLTLSLPPHINPAFLSRKADMIVPKTKYQPSRYIKSVESIGRKECQCIMLDSEEHLYLTDNFIVTHNTYIAVLAALKLLQQKKVDQIIYVRNPIESSKSGKVGFLKGELSEKLAPYTCIVYDKLEELLPPSEIEILKQENRVDSTSVGFVQGKNWACKAVIVDESSNLAWEDLIMLLTRCGEFTRIFFVGDSVNQNYLPKDQSGFRKMFDKFNDQESRDNGFFCFELKEACDIVRSGFVRFVLEKLEIIKQPQL